MTTPSVTERITAYLCGGGLFNPEYANHDAVRDLLIDAKSDLAARDAELASVKAELARLRRPIQYPITTVTGCATDQLFRGHEPGCPVLTAAGNPVCTCYRAAHEEGA